MTNSEGRAGVSLGALRGLAVILAMIGGLLPGVIGTSRLIAADDPPVVNGERLEAILNGEPPLNVAELQAMQDRFQEVIGDVMPSVVGVRVGMAQGSGVIISRDGYVLTAGHVVGDPDLDATFILPDGTEIHGITLGANNGIDSGLMKITDEGNWPYVDMGDSSLLSQGQWVMAVGHPGGFEEGRTPVVRIGRILSSGDRTIRTDCALVGGDSGGPLFDMNGQVIGINSRIGGEITANIHVPVNTYGETWDRLASGEEWGSLGNFNIRGPYIGVTRDPESDDALVAEVDDDGPAARAGIVSGDIIVEFDGRAIATFQSLQIAVLSKQPGDEVTVVVKRGDEQVKLNLTIGQR